MSDILVGNEPAELAAAPPPPASSVEQRPLKSLQQYSELHFPKAILSQTLGGILDPIPSPLSTMPVMSPFEYLSSLPSKGVRSQLVQALNLWIGVAPDVLLATLSIIRDIHNISLMLDDVEDGSPLRRSQPSTHSVFGVPQTINSATYQVVDVISRAAQVCGAVCHGIVVDKMKNMLIGQSHDLFWVSHVAPTVSEYLKMIDGKTDALFRMIAQSSSPHKPANLDRLMILFGRYFQIRDDYANLVVDQYQDSKASVRTWTKASGVSYCFTHWRMPAWKAAVSSRTC